MNRSISIADRFYFAIREAEAQKGAASLCFGDFYYHQFEEKK